MTKITIGVDISKDHLDVHRLPEHTARRFANCPAGHKALIEWIGADPVERIIYEATSPYHRAFERTLGRAGLPLARVNPRQARRFAEATGKLIKTDRVDAAMLARMGALLEPDLTPPASESLDKLKQLLQARRALIKDRTAVRNRQRTLCLMLLKRQAAQRFRQIDSQLAAVDAALEAAIAGEPDLAARFAILLSIPGISKRSAFALLIDMPELGTLDNKQAASLAGLAPVNCQSGTWTGKAFIRGGRAHLRQALYMPALVACRYNPDLKAKYHDLRAAGKPPKVAITAIMRKLVILANALLWENRTWLEKPA